MESEANTGPMGNSYNTRGLTGQTWFRPAVAAWFALLLGGGLWLMPPGVHEGLARGLALSRISPIFVDPLGAAGLAVLCGAFALFGAALGWAVAHRVAEFSRPRPFAPVSQPRRKNREHAQAEEETAEPVRRRRVFSAREDIGEDGIASEEGEDDNGTAAPVVSDDSDDPASSASEFDSVYAELDADYSPPADRAEPADDWDGREPERTEAEAEPFAPADADDIEYAEYEDAEPQSQPDEHETDTWDWRAQDLPEPEHDEQTESSDDEAEGGVYGGDATDLPDDSLVAEENGEDRSQPEDLTEGLDGMSLEALLGRLEDALETHGAMVADSERAASEPPPRPIPMAPPQPMADHSHPAADEDENDPVIAFLRREASRRMPDARPLPADAYDAEEYDGEEYEIDGQRPGATAADREENETHNALRSALERLGQGTRRS